ncbi:MAG TPA: O-antigen ligase family protein [Miltoncostaeaceae bacterium]|nr:O-antigen ligase family protein [Miltoncostaeaceae bacterium]
MTLTAHTERLQEMERLPIVVGAASGILGVGLVLVAGRAPVTAIGICLGILFVCLVLIDVTLGLSAFVLLQFFATLPGADGQDLTVIKLAGGVLVLGWLAAMTSARERRRASGFMATFPVVSLALIAFILWGVLGLLWAPADDLVSEDLQRFALNFVLVAIIATAIRSRRDLTLVIGTFAIGGALSALVGLIFVPPETDGRLGGTIGQSNDFAAALVPAAILAVGMAWSSRTRFRQLVFAGAAVLCIAGVVLSLSRLGFIALPLAFLAWAVFGGRWRPRIIGILCLAAAVGAAVFLLAAPAQHRDRVFDTGGGGSGRTDLWTVAARVWEDHPVRGVGYGNFIEVAPEYTLRPGLLQRVDLIVDDPHHAHNMYLGTLAEGGLVGFGLLMVVIGGGLLASMRAARIFERIGDVRSELLARSVFAAQAGVLVAGFFIYTQFERPMWIAIGLGLGTYGLAVVTRRERTAALERLPRPETLATASS